MHALYLNVRQHGLFLSAFESAYPKVHHTILSFADLYMNKGRELGQHTSLVDARARAVMHGHVHDYTLASNFEGPS
jgi:hypothetical protein